MKRIWSYATEFYNNSNFDLEKRPLASHTMLVYQIIEY